MPRPCRVGLNKNFKNLAFAVDGAPQLLAHKPPPYEEPSPGSPLDIGLELATRRIWCFPAGTNR